MRNAEDDVVGRLPTDPAGLLAWAVFMTAYGGPVTDGGQEVPDQQLWHGTALDVLSEPAADSPDGLCAALAELGITSGGQMRALLRLTAAHAAAAALRHALGCPGPTGHPVDAEDVMNEIAAAQPWLREEPAHPMPRYPDAPAEAVPVAARVALFAEALQRDPWAVQEDGWPVYPWFRALLDADPAWRRDPDRLLRAARHAASDGFTPEHVALWCAGGPLRASGRGWADMDPWLAWAADGWHPTEADECARWEPWRAAGYRAYEAESLGALPDGDVRKPSPDALAVMASLL